MLLAREDTSSCARYLTSFGSKLSNGRRANCASAKIGLLTTDDLASLLPNGELP
jgi:hypothetical protein